MKEAQAKLMAAALLARAELTTLKPRLAGEYRRNVDAVLKLLKEAIEGVNEAEAKERS